MFIGMNVSPTNGCMTNYQTSLTMSGKGECILHATVQKEFLTHQFSTLDPKSEEGDFAKPKLTYIDVFKQDTKLKAFDFQTAMEDRTLWRSITVREHKEHMKENGCECPTPGAENGRGRKERKSVGNLACAVWESEHASTWGLRSNWNQKTEGTKEAT